MVSVPSIGRYKEYFNVNDDPNPVIKSATHYHVTNGFGSVVYDGTPPNQRTSFVPPSPTSLLGDWKNVRSDVYGDGLSIQRFPVANVHHDRLWYDLPLIPDYSVHNVSDGSLAYRIEMTENRPRIWIEGLQSILHDYPGSGSYPHQELMPWLPDSDRADLCLEAMNYFNDAFPTHLSFAEFLQGFTQLADLLPKIEESVTKTMSGAYLNKSFGWDNLLADLNTLSGLFDSVTSRMDYLRRTYGRPQRMGFSRKDCYNPTLSSYAGLYGPPPGSPSDSGFWRDIELVEYHCHFRATATILQTLDWISDFSMFLRVLAGEIGLNNPIKALWNCMPLSFVVDWFAGVSSWLDRWTRATPAIGWGVFGITHSVTYEATYKIRPAGNYPSYYWVFDQNVEGTIKRKLYTRFTGLSVDLDLIDLDGLSPDQFSLFLALLYQFG